MCGGQSLRMGQDKGLIHCSNYTWAEAAAKKIDALSLPVVCSVAQHNLAAYQALFQEQQLITDDTALPVGGPLKGILSVHRQFPEEDLLVLAVDMPAMNKAILLHLLDTAKKNVFEAFVFQNNERLEPLCAVYTTAGLRRIMAMIQCGALARFSMHYVLEQLQTKIIPLSDDDSKRFSNINTPEDLHRL